ncbi:MAG: YHS domain-containing protein [Saprospiraceae bacterium]|nr:YHS domain-containing protein [Saprospiraceae bacterium]
MKKKNLLIIIALCLTQALLAQSKKDTLATMELIPLSPKSIDPVCRMRLRRGAADSIDYKGIRYGFCDTVCRQKFLAKPYIFIKQ